MPACLTDNHIVRRRRRRRRWQNETACITCTVTHMGSSLSHMRSAFVSAHARTCISVLMEWTENEIIAMGKNGLFPLQFGWLFEIDTFWLWFVRNFVVVLLRFFRLIFGLLLFNWMRIVHRIYVCIFDLVAMVWLYDIRRNCVRRQNGTRIHRKHSASKYSQYREIVHACSLLCVGFDRSHEFQWKNETNKCQWKEVETEIFNRIGHRHVSFYGNATCPSCTRAHSKIQLYIYCAVIETDENSRCQWILNTWVSTNVVYLLLAIETRRV